jgi:hypothetical protein
MLAVITREYFYTVKTTAGIPFTYGEKATPSFTEEIQVLLSRRIGDHKKQLALLPTVACRIEDIDIGRNNIPQINKKVRKFKITFISNYCVTRCS